MIRALQAFQGLRAFALLFALVVGSIGLMIQGDFGGAAIGLLILAMLVLVAASPFRHMPHAERRAARVTATATVLAGWLAAGILLWDWQGSDFAFAGVIAVIALLKAAFPPRSPEPPDPQAAQGPA